MSLLQKLRSLFNVSSETPSNFEGQWAGHYGYGDQYPEVMQKQVVKFIAQLNMDGDEFEGFIKEDETNGIPEISKIDGIIRGQKIVFAKTYARTYAVDKNGEREIVAEQPQIIIYSGLCNESKNKFTGQWKIEALYKTPDGHTQKH